ncbi:MAG: transcriptional regulator [Desulfobulbaceae bacterium]|uniref:Transcriptional regulator n=1 Tax=Candidatus Desulfatifera sulfidica TaxID=2841691 RepID=A0A8J6TDM1_9BACT|nr:transcriptional regulator [Candidatus Desulfatifera sulfidica]
MDKIEFSQARKKLLRTQQQLADLLGVSLKAIHSYEQGWRPVPAHIERQLFFFLSKIRHEQPGDKPCWEIKKCGMKDDCPAYEFSCGHLCWFICGTRCDCTDKLNAKEKIAICRSCDILKSLLE